MHVKMTISYDGAPFRGFSSQVGVRTVQGEVERALSTVFGCAVKTVGAGRTDAGVSATGQVISFLLPNDQKDVLNSAKNPPKSDEKSVKNDTFFVKTDTFFAKNDTFCADIMGQINAKLPPEIRVLGLELKDKFNARQAATAKTYVYKCAVAGDGMNGKNAHAAKFGAPKNARTGLGGTTKPANHYLLTRYPDIEKMRAATKFLMGARDFSKFSNETDTKVRTIFGIEIIEKNVAGGCDNVIENGRDNVVGACGNGVAGVCGKGTVGAYDNSVCTREILFSVRGDAFLKNQVRIMVGVLIEIGLGRLAVGDIEKIFRGTLTTRVMLPAYALVLENVEF
jgi:tRNA pseudouridine(38-40) synthase